MAGLTTIGGLVSGLDTATIIDQLVAVEGNKQTLLKTRLSAVKNTSSSLQTVNVQLASLANAAKALADSTGWTTRATTSSSTNVSASATTSAAAGAYSFIVDRTATAHRAVFATTANADDRVIPDGTTTVTFTGSDGTPQSIDAGDGTLTGLVSAINAAELGVRATVVTLADGTQRLSVAAIASGTDSAFTLTDANGGAILGGPDATRSTVGQDAQITVDGDLLTSSSNTFADVFEGVTFTLSSMATAGESVTLDVTTDAKAISTSVGKLVEQVNAIIAEIGLKTSFNQATGSGSPLTGNSEVRAVREQLLSAVTGGVNGSSLASFGIEVTRDGKLEFDAAQFEEAFAADPAAVEAAFTATSTVGDVETPVGFAARLQQLAERASDSEVGTITTAIKGFTSTADDLTRNIEAWDLRLVNRRTALERQFTAMETALSSLQNQASWLSGQIASLPSYDNY